MKTKSTGITALAVGFPKQVRTNEWFKENQPAAFAHVEGKALSQVFGARAHDDNTRSFEETMAGYLRDPFRGTKERRVMDKDASPIDLERDTALEALRVAKLSIEDIDLIIVSAFPTANPGIGDGVYLAKALGTRCPAYNVESACSGGLASLQLASAMVAAGQAKRVLVVVSCIYSRACDWSDTLTWFLGDGVGAYVVSEVPEGEGFVAFHSLNTAPTCGSFGFNVEDNRAVIRAGADAGRQLRDGTPRSIRDVCGGVLRDAGLTTADIDFFVPNTPLAWFAEMFAQILEIPKEKTVSTYEEYANMGPALNPVNLHRALAQGSIAEGDTVLLFTVGSVSTAAAAVLRMSKVALGNVIER